MSATVSPALHQATGSGAAQVEVHFGNGATLPIVWARATRRNG